MVAGQVSYHDRTKVKRLKVVKENAIVNALNRTKTVSSQVTAASFPLLLSYSFGLTHVHPDLTATLAPPSSLLPPLC